MAKWNAVTARIKSVSITPTVSSPSPILVRSSLRTKIAPTIYLCALLDGSLLKKNWLFFLLLFLYNMFDKPTIYRNSFCEQDLT